MNKESIPNKKALANIIKILLDITSKNLPYNQRVIYQDGLSESEYITDYKKLTESGVTCCLMGYLLASKHYQKWASKNCDELRCYFTGCVARKNGKGQEIYISPSIVDKYLNMNISEKYLYATSSRPAREALKDLTNTYFTLL